MSEKIVLFTDYAAEAAVEQTRARTAELSEAEQSAAVVRALVAYARTEDGIRAGRRVRKAAVAVFGGEKALRLHIAEKRLDEVELAEARASLAPLMQPAPESFEGRSPYWESKGELRLRRSVPGVSPYDTNYHLCVQTEPGKDIAQPNTPFVIKCATVELADYAGYEAYRTREIQVHETGLAMTYHHLRIASGAYPTSDDPILRRGYEEVSSTTTTNEMALAVTEAFDLAREEQGVPLIAAPRHAVIA